MNCLLCKNTGAKEYYEDKFRQYFQCQNCALVFVPSNKFPSLKEENDRYNEHNNDPSDERYVAFLNKMLLPMLDIIKKGDKGLDFGSGPEPVLAGLFKKEGFDVAIYDKFYAKDSSVMNGKYEFITATEVVEHLQEPRMELERLWDCLKIGGTLGIMTKLTDGVDFNAWNYKNDQTHVIFFSRKTFEYLAKELGAKLDFMGNDLIFLEKN